MTQLMKLVTSLQLFLILICLSGVFPVHGQGVSEFKGVHAKRTKATKSIKLNKPAKSSQGVPEMALSPSVQTEGVWISRKDGSQSCGIKAGDTLEQAQAELAKASVQVLESRKASDGKMHIQVCGADSGQMNHFKIKLADLSKAIALGYFKN